MSRLSDYVSAVGVGVNITCFLVCAATGLWFAAVLNLVMASFNFHFSYKALMGEVQQ